MKKLIRLTESDLHGIIQRSVMRILQEDDNSLLLQEIAQALVQQFKRLDAYVGENDVEVDLHNGKFAYITYEVISSPYLRKGMQSGSRDVPDDADEVIDEPSVEISSIDYCNDGGECTQIHDNGIIKQALERVIEVDYTNYDVPSEEDYFYYED